MYSLLQSLDGQARVQLDINVEDYLARGACVKIHIGGWWLKKSHHVNKRVPRCFNYYHSSLRFCFRDIFIINDLSFLFPFSFFSFVCACGNG